MISTENMTTLNGIWQFCIDHDESKADGIISGDYANWRQVDVPCDVAHACPERPDYIGPCWFRKEFSLPPEMRGKRILLHFEAVNYTATVFLNGKFVGRNMHGFLPFEFDITDCVLQDGKNTLLAMTDHRRD